MQNEITDLEALINEGIFSLGIEDLFMEGYLSGRHWNYECPPAQGEHEYVNMGFNTIVMACKHCNKLKPKQRLTKEMKIGNVYFRSDNDKEVKITAETQNGYSGEYVFLGSDGFTYQKGGEVVRWNTNNHRQSEPYDWFLHEGEKA